MMIENFIKCPGLGNLGVGMYGPGTLKLHAQDNISGNVVPCIDGDEADLLFLYK